MFYSGIVATTLKPWITEKFDDRNSDKVDKWAWVAFFVFLLIVVIELLFAVFAVYLSWTSNSLIGWNVFSKVFFAIFAFLFAINYLLIHLFNKVDLLKHIRLQNESIAALLAEKQSVLLIGGKPTKSSQSRK